MNFGMEYQRISNLLDNRTIQPIKFRSNDGLKLTMNHVQNTTPLVKSDLRLQYCGQVYVMTVMNA